MGKFRQPCLDCGALTSGGSRCDVCQHKKDLIHDEKRAARKKATGQYAGKYRVKAKIVRETAVTCWICGQGAIPGDPWQADHLNPGEHGNKAILLPAHASCNRKRSNNV